MASRNAQANVPKLASLSASAVLEESIMADPEATAESLFSSDKGETLARAMLVHMAKQPDCGALVEMLKSKHVRRATQMAAEAHTRNFEGLDPWNDVVRVAECCDGVEEITLGNLPVSKMPKIVQELIACVLEEEGKKTCYKGGTTVEHFQGDGDDGAVDRFYDGSIAITPEAMFDRSFDDYLTNKYGADNAGAEEISDMSGVAFEADDDDEEEPDISDFMSNVVEKAEEELRSILDDMHKEVYQERTSSSWFQNCVKRKEQPSDETTAREEAAEGAAASGKKRTLPFDRKGGEKRVRKTFDMSKLPIFERRPILTILYDSNNW